MLTQLTSRLASQLNDLTIQVVKEDLTLPSMPLNNRGSSTGRVLPLPTEGKPLTAASLVGQGKFPTPLTTTRVEQTAHKHSLGTPTLLPVTVNETLPS